MLSQVLKALRWLFTPDKPKRGKPRFTAGDYVFFYLIIIVLISWFQ